VSRKDLIEDLYPLSPTQQGLLFHALYAPRSGQYIEQLSCTLRGALERVAFQGAWERVVQRHPALRTVFLWEKRDEPVQLVYRRVRLRWREEDWRELSGEAQETHFQALFDEEQEVGFDLTRPPLMRFSLLRVEEGAWRFLWTHHHLLLDGWSLPMVVQEVFRAYASLVRREEPALPPARPYSAFLDWLSRQDLGEAERYWRGVLAGFRAPTPLGVDRPTARTGGSGFEEAWAEVEIAPLQDFARRHRLTLGTLIQGAWAALLARYSGEEDVLFGLTVSGRPADLPGVESIVGLFINTLPARVDLSTDAPLVSWLSLLQERQSEMLRFSHTPLVEAQRWSEVPRGTPLFETILVIENYPVSLAPRRSHGEDDLAVEDVRAAERTHYPVTVTAIPGHTLRLSVSWDRSRLDRDAARRLLGHLAVLLEAMPCDPQRRAGDLPLLTAAEVRHMREQNPPPVDWPGEAPVHELFAARARSAPDAVAVVHGEERVTYGELARAAARVARALLAAGVGPEDRVGVRMERSPRALAAILGTLQAGAAYVPLDPSYGSRRLSLLVEDVDLRLLLTEGDAPEMAVRVLRVDSLPEAADGGLPPIRIELDALAYVIYTSGSTGRPKGVMVSHRSLANAFLAWEEAYRLSADTTAHLQMASLSFDVFSGDMARALASGGRLVICPRDLLLSPADLLALAEREGVDAAEFVPAVMRQVADHLEEHGGDLSHLRLLAIGSDAWYGADLNRLLRLIGPRTRLVNSYGVTEATIDSSWYEASGELPGDAPVPIGHPFANSSLHVVDRDLRTVPAGVAGELVLGGRGLARGYFARPDLTAERFVPDPFGSEPGARLYRTGDLARRRPDGLLELLGRADHQVKVRGHRIEPGEVEAALGEHPSVARCVVVARRDGGGAERRLVGYVVPRSGAEPAALDLRRFLSERLPEPMVPASFVLLGALPLTPNGKIDRGALPAPSAADLAPSALPAVPRDEVEEELARIWSEILRVDRVGIHDDFFDLGGDSILSIQIVSRAHRAGLRITPRQVFESPTVAALAEIAGRVRTGAEPGPAPGATAPATPEIPAGPVPLTPIQSWFFAEGFTEAHHWNQALLLESARPLDRVSLEAAVRGLEARHDALRLRFRRGEGGWEQRLEPAGSPSSFVFIDLSALPEARRLPALESAAASLQASLDLEAGPLCRFALLRPGHVPDRFFAAVHHLAVDGVSWGILLQDLAGPIQEPSTPFAAWARSLAVASEVIRSEAPVWLACPADVPALPLDGPGGPDDNTVASLRTLSVELDADDTRALLQEVHRSARARIDEALLAALALAFRRWTGRGPLLVDLEGHGREEVLVGGADLSRTVGWFTSVAPVWLKADGNPAQALREAKEQLRSLPRHGIGHGLLRWLGDFGTRERLAALPRPEVSFNYLGQVDRTVPAGAFSLAPESPGPMASPNGRRPYLLEINALTSGGRLRADWTYSAALHGEDTVRRLAEGFAEALRELIGVARSAASRTLVLSDFPLARLDAPALVRLAAAAAAGGEVEDIYPLSPMQEGMLFHSLMAPRSGVYVEHLSFAVRGDLDLEAFRGAWTDAVERHPILRSAFVWEGMPEPLQVVRGRVNIPWRELDWTDLEEDEQRRRLAELMAEDRRQGFDLSSAPLLRLTAVRAGEGLHRFLWCHHHALLDGWSVPLLLADILALYQARAAGDSPRLPDRRPFRDYIAWLREQDLAPEAEHWREALRGLGGPTPLGVDRPILAGDEAPDLVDRRARLDEERTASIQAFARRHRLTLNTLLQAAWALLLGRYGGEDDVLYGCTVSGRPPELPRSETMIGLFINTLPVRVRMPAGRLLLPWLAGLQSVLADLRQHEHVPLVEIQRWTGWPTGRPLFESVFVFENYPVGEVASAAGGARVVEVSSAEGTNFPLTLAAAPGSRLVLTVSYDRHRFDEPAIARLLCHLETLLDGMVTDPERAVDELPVLSEAERAALVLEWNDTASDLGPDVCAHRLFEEQARLRPNAPAVEMGERVLTYCELDDLAELIAERLRAQGVRPGSRVALRAGRSPETIAGLLGILKAGGAFVPLDPQYPEERLAFMLEDSGAEVVISGVGEDCFETSLPSVPPVEPGPDDLAYVIYTSGSTGRPKGTALAHRGLTNLMRQGQFRGLGPDERTLQFASLSFDAAVWEIFPTLGLGGTLVLAPPGLLPGQALLGFLRDRAVTHATLPPSTLATFPTREELPALRTLIAAAEACPPELVDRWAPGRRFLNGYGPTEATVCTNVARCMPGGGRPHLGRPIPNMRVYLLDRLGRLMPLGAPGEIAIGGVGLAHGYLGRPGLTAERFVPDPFNSLGRGGRLYRTGDLGRQRPDGALEFLGRIDHQLKVRGHRVEAGEVEAALVLHPEVCEAVVTVWRRTVDDQRLVAHVALRSDVPGPELNAFLHGRLPAHMVPAHIVVLPEMPRLPNGKLDRRSLPAPDAGASAAPSSPPRTPLEQEIAGVWREVLGLESVGVEDNFFDLGGHSLLVVRVHGRLRALGHELEMLDLFHHPTVAALADRLAPVGQDVEKRCTIRRRPVSRQDEAHAPDIAIVGLSCRFPQAPDPEAFWRNLRAGVESVAFLSREELLAEGVPPSLADDPHYVPAKGLLDGIDLFDAGFFQMTPREAERMDPQHRVFLEVCWEALESAACDPSRYPGAIGVFGGETLSTYLFHLASDPRIGAAVAGMQTMIGLDREFLTTTVSYKLDLRGPSFTLQTACSTSLVAVGVACQSLRAHQCDMALAGGVSIRVPARRGYLYQEGGIEAPDGHCRAFDADARGTLSGDGAGVVLLKRLEEALRDGDPVRAVIRGWALNNDGSGKIGYTAPSVAGQAEAIAAAQDMAGVDPETITFVEGHGTATPLGDPIEVAALTKVFRESTPRRGFCALGAVKSNFGHLDAAAGVAGLIKTVLALEHKEIPPTVHFQRPNPETRMETSPFFVNSTVIPWKPEGPRRAGVSSFGLGGTNAHVVVEEAPVSQVAGEARTWQLFPISARSGEALGAASANLARWMDTNPESGAADVAWTLQAGRKAFPVRRILVARDLREASRRLAVGESFTGLASGCRPAFFILPGQGVQRAGMGGQLYREEPAFRERIDRCSEALRSRLGIDLHAVLAGGDQAERLVNCSEVGHPALFALEYALAGLWMDWGVRPAAMLGYSLGEWVAACLAGVFSPEDALGLLAERGRLMDGVPEGAMLSVPLLERDLLPLLAGSLELSGVNAPGLASVSGTVDDVERLRSGLEARGVLCRRIEAARAFHSSAMEPVARELARLVAGVERRAPALPFLSNLTGTWIRPEQAVDPGYWAAHVRYAVRFGDGMAELLRSGDGALLEIGPGGTLGAQARRQPELLGDRPVLASMPRPREGAPEEPEPVSLLTALGSFWTSGGEVDWEGFRAGRRRRKLTLPTYPFERRRYWVEVKRSAPSPLLLTETPEERVESMALAADARPSLGRPYVAPRTEAERRVSEIWTQVLGIGGIGADDDFYELGGDSLRALDLLARVRAAFGVELPLRAMLEASTVTRLAVLVGEPEVPAAPERPGQLVTIQPGNGRVPLFLVHPAGGHVLGYRPLAERLGADRPVYGLEARGTQAGETPCETIEEMAAEHVAALTALRPHGPYILGGASMGGTVAWEMARQLHGRGERVGLVVLFDTPGPGQMPRDFKDDAEILAYLGGTLLGLSDDDLRRMPPQERLPRALERAASAGLIPPGVDLERAASLVELFRVHVKAMMTYRPGTYAGRVAFFRAADRRPVDPPYPEVGWIGLAEQGAEVHVVPGDHGTMYLPPHVDTLARRLRRCLEERE